MSLHPEFMFATTDYEGTPVVLSRTTWHAKAGNDTIGTHPEIRDYVEEVQATIMCHLTSSFKVPAMPVLEFSTAYVRGVGTLLANILWLS
jgi:hypothetical protein